MSRPGSLLFGVHAHQPMGNFPEIVDKIHAQCYRPFLTTLHRYPAFRFSAHFSGHLLDYLHEYFPEDMRLLTEMVARGQVEMFGAGYAEPILAAIPHRDRVGQIEHLSRMIDHRYGRRPTGAWLTERVWESTVVTALADCGISYVVVDDYHFLCTGIRAEELLGFYSTEEDERRIDIFPISEALRYRLPFAPPTDAAAYIEEMIASTDGSAAIYFDDIEKFGAWPDTYEWVYGKKWLTIFIERVLSSKTLSTCTFAAYHAARRTLGPVYLPTVSYYEMNEWTLPPKVADTYGQLTARIKADGNSDALKPFLRGGIWKNFLMRYPEANWMHKRMLGLSARLAAATGEPEYNSWQDLLYGAQANDAYWHGLFGGLYLPHLRRAIYRNLLTLEAALDAKRPRPAASRSDIDYDGNDELFLQNGQLQAVIKLDGLAALIELDDYALRQNFGDTLRRHEERYHRSVGLAPQETAREGGIASPHDRLSFKEAITPEDVRSDPAPQFLLRDFLVGAELDIMPVDQYLLEVSGESNPTVTFRAHLCAGSVTKQLALAGHTLTTSYRVNGLAGKELRTRLPLAMPSCDGVAGRYVVADEIIGGFGQPFDWPAIAGLSLEDLFLQGRIVLEMKPAARVTVRPYHTVSQSENGLERIMQFVDATISWPITHELEVLTITLRTEDIVT